MEGGLVEHLTLQSAAISDERDRDRLETYIAGIEGVRDVVVDPAEHGIQITYDPTIVNATRLRAAVEQAGYKLDSAGADSTEGEAAGFLSSEVTAADSGANGKPSGSEDRDVVAIPAAGGSGPTTAGLGTSTGNASFGPAVVPVPLERDADGTGS